MKYFRGSLTEINGEREYSTNYLIQANTLPKAYDIIRDYARTYFNGEDGGEEIEPGVFEFEDGCYIVKVGSLQETTKRAYAQEIVNLHTLRG